jgi:translation elongation factor EF-G
MPDTVRIDGAHWDELCASLDAALKELVGDDRTFAFTADPQTGELVVSGMSEVHVNMMLRRLRRRRKVEVETFPPKIPYKETITRMLDKLASMSLIYEPRPGYWAVTP